MAQSTPREQDAPATNALEVVPNDSVDLLATARALYIGSAGNMQVTTSNGSTVTFIGLLAGQILPVSVQRVWSTTTTAGSIVALYG